jgi:hypothetical protein
LARARAPKQPPQPRSAAPPKAPREWESRSFLFRYSTTQFSAPLFPCSIGGTARIIALTGECELSVTLTPVIQSGYWRVRLTWPGHAARFFGRFNSQADAERWIAEHRWLTEQREPANGDYPEGTDGC